MSSQANSEMSPRLIGLRLPLMLIGIPNIVSLYSLHFLEMATGGMREVKLPAKKDLFPTILWPRRTLLNQKSK